MIKQCLLVLAFSIVLPHISQASQVDSVGGELLSQSHMLEKMAVYYFLSINLNISGKRLHDDVINGEYQEKLKEEQEAIKIVTFRPLDIQFLYGYSESILDDLSVKTVDDFNGKKLNILYRLVERIIKKTSCTESFRDDYSKFYLVSKAIENMKLLSFDKYDDLSGSDKYHKSYVLINRLESGSCYSNAEGLIHSKIISLFQEPYYKNIPEVVYAMLNMQDCKVELLKEEARDFISNYHRNNPNSHLDKCLDLIRSLHAQGSFSDMAKILEVTENLEAETKNIVFDILFYNLVKNYNNLRAIDIAMLRRFDSEKLHPRSQKKYFKILFPLLKTNISAATSEDLALFRCFDENNLGNLLLHIVSHPGLNILLDKAQAIEELKQLKRYKELAEALLADSENEYSAQIWEIINLIESQEDKDTIAYAIIRYLPRTTAIDFCQKAISVFNHREEKRYIVFALSVCLDHNNPDISSYAEGEIAKLYERSNTEEAGIITDKFADYAEIFLKKAIESEIRYKYKIIDIVLNKNILTDASLKLIRSLDAMIYSIIKIRDNHFRNSNPDVRIAAINMVQKLLSGDGETYPTSEYYKKMFIEILQTAYTHEKHKEVKLTIEEHLKTLNIKINNSGCSIS